LIATFHDEILAHRGEVPNFASFLRVTCMRHLRRRLQAAEKALEDSRAEGEPLPPRLAVVADRASNTIKRSAA